MRLSFLAAALMLPAVAAAQTTVYSNTFESGPLGAEWSGAGSLQSTGGLSAFGFGSTHLKNDGATATMLTLSGLASHSTMTLSFSLAMWDSIDWGSDLFVVSANGVDLFNGLFGNYFTPSGECEGPGTRVSGAFTSFSAPDYGYNTANHDCGRAVSFTFAHSASNVVFSFSYPNTQLAPDESFGVDNILVQTNATGTPPVGTVPEPGTYGLFAMGLVAVAAASRKRSN